MPLAALTGPDAPHLAHIQRQTAGAVGFALAAKGVVHISQGICKCELRVALQECRHLSLVLLRRKGAGGIHQLPARGQHGGCTVQNFRAQLSTLLHQRFTMLLTSHRLLAEHALAGTGCIHQNTVKKLRQSVRNAGGRLIEHHRIGHAHAFQITFQDLGAGRKQKTDAIDPAVGLVMDVRIGDFVKQGDPLATLHLNRMELAEGAIARMQQAVRLTSEKPATPPLVYAAVSPEGVAR